MCKGLGAKSLGPKTQQIRSCQRELCLSKPSDTQSSCLQEAVKITVLRIKISLENAILFFFKFKTKFLKGFIFNRKYKILFIHSLADSYIQRQELLTQMWDEFHIICFSSNTGQSILAKKKSICFYKENNPKAFHRRLHVNKSGELVNRNLSRSHMLFVKKR